VKVNLYEAFANGSGGFKRGDLLATSDLEVVPGGTYVIDGVPYTLVGRPTFHLTEYRKRGSRNTHIMTMVDLLVQRN
jgi:hypothetical protein